DYYCSSYEGINTLVF
nr:immunoglobulin light chain junction region [Macaca mulatta]MOX28215.1 immunoglobulin light chain junction region [Macaca mulatta]MOX28226.1 immunoglobulin light chain junction region [Macaca mulatta]MOX28267.1 immunoglobulin light chain junction region [Macaca mulatta]MOX28285.1 immunoglobulin light chain junction region [Macaca mulatta]